MKPITKRLPNETDEQYENRHALNVEAWLDDQDRDDRDPPDLVQVDCDVFVWRKRR